MPNYFLTLTSRGELLNDTVTIDDEQFRDIFFAQLQCNTLGYSSDYPYCSVIGEEVYFLSIEDTPYVFSRFDGKRLYYSPSGYVMFNPEELAYHDGVIYHVAPHGRWGRLGLNVAIELSDCIEQWGSWYALHWNGELFVIPPRLLPENIRLLRPKVGNLCAGCGRDNPNGFKLTVIYDDQYKRADSWVHIPVHACGGQGTMHGGYIALLLDEIMGKVLSGLSIKAPTLQLNVRYLKPVELGMFVHISAYLVAHVGSRYFLRGMLEDARNKQLFARAEGIFIAVK